MAPYFMSTVSGGTEFTLIVQGGAGAHSVAALGVLTKLSLCIQSAQFCMHFTPSAPLCTVHGKGL